MKKIYSIFQAVSVVGILFILAACRGETNSNKELQGVPVKDLVDFGLMDTSIPSVTNGLISFTKFDYKFSSLMTILHDGHLFVVTYSSGGNCLINHPSSPHTDCQEKLVLGVSTNNIDNPYLYQ